MKRSFPYFVLSLGLAVAIGACGKKDDQQTNNTTGAATNNAAAAKPEFVEAIVHHHTLSSKVNETYKKVTGTVTEYLHPWIGEMCFMLVKQANRQFVQLRKGYCSSSSLEGTTAPLIQEFELVGYRLLSKTGVDVGVVYQHANGVKNIHEFCTGDLKANCQIEFETYRDTNQREGWQFKTVKVTEATITRP